MRSSKTFGGILDQNRGAGPGFDLLRIGLAVSIFASHASTMAGNNHLLSTILASLFHTQIGVDQVSDAAGVTADLAQSGGLDLQAMGRSATGLGRPYTLSRVPMFFALSGFLVASSAVRTPNLFRFLGLRALRIFPALTVEVVLSALLLGVFFTTLPLPEYFHSPELFRYFGNILGIVHMELPGVFKTGSHSSAVNGNLWTLPAEFYCYVTLSVIMLIGLFKSRLIYSLLFVACSLTLAFANTMYGVFAAHDVLSDFVIIYYFTMGVMFFQWKDKIPYSYVLFAVSIILFVSLSYSHYTIFIYPAALTYITLFIGMTKFPSIPLLNTGDYSYGVYLYGYPITQAVIAALPVVRGSFALIMFVALPLTFLFAAGSWHVVEKRALRLKRFISPRSAALTNQIHQEVAEPPLVEGVAPSPIR